MAEQSVHDQLQLTRLSKGSYHVLGSVKDWPDLERLNNIPSKLGECTWTLLQDNLFNASPHRVTTLVRLP